MQDRFKFRYVFTKDFGGKTGICYKMPIFNLDTIIDENFNKIVKSYIDYGYKLISIEQSTGLKDKNGKLIYEGDIVKGTCGVYWGLMVVEHLENRASFVYRRLGGKYYPLPILGECNFEELIGNIYENPELLKEVEQCQ